MENKFCLLNCRFDKKNKRKLLIQGYFEQNKLQGCRPIVSLDYQLLEYEVITRTILDNPLEYTEFGRQTKRYFLAVTLPENYKDFQKVRCFQYEDDEIEELFSVSVKWLAKKENEEVFHVDEAVWGNRDFRISGWCTSTGEAKLYLSSYRDGRNILPVQIKRVRRVDAEKECPDCSPQEVFGFEITVCSGR